MKRFLKRFLKKLVAVDAGKAGYEALPVNVSPLNSKSALLKNLFTLLQQLNFTPTHIVDVGANHGTWTRDALAYFPNSYYTLIEPQAQLQASVADILKHNPSVNFYSMGAGKQAATLLFTIADCDDSSSFLYTEKEAASLGLKQVSVPMVTLNEFLTSLQLPVPEIIKIDAEGLDMEVLEGANNFFGLTEIFIVEASVMNKFFENTVLKVMSFMDANGYRLFDITDLNRTNKQQALWLVELVFIKKNGIIDQAVTSYN